MTVPVQTIFNESVANGATTVFPYGFKITAAEDLQVSVGGVVVTTGFTVSGVGDDLGGNVTFSVAPANGLAVLRELNPIVKRTTDYQQFGDWFAQNVNKDFDRVVLMIQKFLHDTKRALKLPVNTTTDQVLTATPAQRVGKTIKFDADGNLILSTQDPDANAASAAAVLGDIAPAVNIAAAKTPVVDADVLPVLDSAAAFGLKKITLTTLWTWIQSKLSAAAVSVGAATASTHALQASQKPGFPINLNGNMQIAQTGTSFVAPVTGAYDLDGWLNTKVGAAVFTVAQVAGSSSGKLSRQVTITTADASIAAGDYVTDTTKIEGSDIVQLVGQAFTVSFRAKFPLTGIHCVALRNSGNDRSYVVEVNCVAANTWASYSFTVTGGLPTAGTWNYTTGTGLVLEFCHAAGTTFHTTAGAWNVGSFLSTVNQVNDCATNANVWALEDVRVDLGLVAGTELPTYQRMLAACQRYYEEGQLIFIGSASGAAGSIGSPIKFSVTKRATPTVTSTNVTENTNLGALQISPVSTTGFRAWASSVAAGNTFYTAEFTASARL